MKTNRFLAPDIAAPAGRIVNRCGFDSLTPFWAAKMIPTARFK